MTNYTIIQNSIIHNTNIIVSNNILTASVTNAHSIHSCADTQSDHQLRNTQFLSAFSTQLYMAHNLTSFKVAQSPNHKIDFTSFLV